MQDLLNNEHMTKIIKRLKDSLFYMTTVVGVMYHRETNSKRALDQEQNTVFEQCAFTSALRQTR